MNNNLVEIKDIPMQFQDLAEEIGVNNFIKVCRLLGGTLTYIPSLKTIEKNSRNKAIIAGFNGWNYKELSRKYHISEPYVRRIINNAKYVKS